MRAKAAPSLTPAEKILNDAWDKHMQAEFVAHSADEALRTMVDHPRVLGIPLVGGGEGRDELHTFYARYFLSQIPPDTAATPVSRTIGQGRLVDEFILKFTHSIQMDWLAPGIPATGKRVEVAFIVVVEFEGDKLAGERLYWDQASVLVQLGRLDPAHLPVAGVDAARAVLDHGIPLNGLIVDARAAR